MDLGELQVFLTVAREGSFSRAAERLYRTQPAISLGIRKLEDSLGQPLFVRGSRPVRLTDAGVLLKEYAERLLNLRDEAKKGLSELEGLKEVCQATPAVSAAAACEKCRAFAFILPRSTRLPSTNWRAARPRSSCPASGG